LHGVHDIKNYENLTSTFLTTNEPIIDRYRAAKTGAAKGKPTPKEPID